MRSSNFLPWRIYTAKDQEMYRNRFPTSTGISLIQFKNDPFINNNSSSLESVIHVTLLYSNSTKRSLQFIGIGHNISCLLFLFTAPSTMYSRNVVNTDNKKSNKLSISELHGRHTEHNACSHICSQEEPQPSVTKTQVKTLSHSFYNSFQFRFVVCNICL